MCRAVGLTRVGDGNPHSNSEQMLDEAGKIQADDKKSTKRMLRQIEQTKEVREPSQRTPSLNHALCWEAGSPSISCGSLATNGAQGCHRRWGMASRRASVGDSLRGASPHRAPPAAAAGCGHHVDHEGADRADHAHPPRCAAAAAAARAR